MADSARVDGDRATGASQRPVHPGAVPGAALAALGWELVASGGTAVC
jgi:hypothetical protein